MFSLLHRLSPDSASVSPSCLSLSLFHVRSLLRKPSLLIHIRHAERDVVTLTRTFLCLCSATAVAAAGRLPGQSRLFVAIVTTNYTSRNINTTTGKRLPIYV